MKETSNDGGLLLLREVEKQIGLLCCLFFVLFAKYLNHD